MSHLNPPPALALMYIAFAVMAFAAGGKKKTDTDAGKNQAGTETRQP